MNLVINSEEKRKRLFIRSDIKNRIHLEINVGCSILYYLYQNKRKIKEKLSNQ